MKFILTITLLSLTITAPASKGEKDWPMWGGSPDRNMIAPAAKGMPTDWDVRTGRNVKWVAELGSQSYGNTIVAEGVVLVGTNNEALRDPEQAGDRGVLMAFRESDGEFLWQATHEKLLSGRANDWPFQGIASSPLVRNGVAYYMSNRAELVAVDIHGFHDGVNNGPYKDEKLTGKHDVDIIWIFDTMEEVGNFPHNLANSSPVFWENLIFVSTSNGQDESHVNVPSPKAPALIAIDMVTGELVWEDGSPGENILHGQWSTPAIATVGGVVQVVHAQGDGWVRGFEAKTGKKLWEFDTNPKDSVWPKTRNEVISTPVIVDNVVYIANGQDPEHGEGIAHAYAIDATKRGDISPTLADGKPNPNSGAIWHYTDIRRSISTAAVKDGLVYMADFSGFLHCIDAKTGKQVWKHDMFAAMWGSPIIIGDKIYLGDEDGDITILQHGRELKVINEVNMGSSVYATAVPANGTLFIMNRNQIYALQEGAQLKK
jgi:outer membrane protein assembly factor BamB